MICEKCNQEIDDDANFCPYCGKKFNIVLKKNSALSLVLLSLLLCVFGIISLFMFTVIPRTPEYAFYKACVSIKNHDYEKSVEYINIDKTVDNRISAITQELYSLPKLKKNPFGGLAYLFINALTDKIKFAIKKKVLGEIVYSNDNIFQDIKEPQLIYFLVVKSYNDVYLTKDTRGDSEVLFKLVNAKDDYELGLVLDKKNSTQWEIVDILGYNFLARISGGII